MILESSGGFKTTNTALASISSSDKTPSLSSTSQRPSNNSVFIIGDDESGSASSRSTSFCYDRPGSFSEDPLSPVFQGEQPSPSINNYQRPISISSSSSSSMTSAQQYSPAVVRTAPLYISVYTSTPPMPIVKDTVSSSAPPTNDEETVFNRRSPSPQISTVLRKNEQMNNTIKSMSPSSIPNSPNANSPQFPVSKLRRQLATSSDEHEKL